MTRHIEIIEPGPLTLVQDLGRVGHLAVGVGRAGAADVGSYRLGGRLVGNSDGCAALEVTFGGLSLRAHGDIVVCLTGAPVPAEVDGRAQAHATPFTLRDGQVLSLRMPLSGLRTYVSFRGGLAVPQVLGSSSTDTMSGLGPEPLRAGQRLEIGQRTEGLPHVDHAAVAPPAAGVVELAVLPGPRRDWFADPGRLAAAEWVVSGRSDRKGIRFEGEPIERHTQWRDAELPSEGMVRGAIQVPPNGLPVLFLNDHPVTGGYPVIGVVRSAHVDRAAQLQPGQQVRFRWEETR
ncbi:biotin-dependent carboxyltransferase family protein [Intrasporangium calvum]|uniref:Biotin-dependent carboxyltransferase family protein n=1 Tax=Intrasporangium calvum TaxID=53358 RepID=A0ABT5GFT6_9MICO|nr:biotin-dependent carboxyltransferase family protein [Intrasporangium calvum]MDC5697069.1 biotin-dependent carboxyltransferase family protein [Intrasporangium calvum]